MTWLIALILMSLHHLIIKVLLPGFDIVGIIGSIILIFSFILTSMRYGFSAFLIQLIVSIVFITFLIHIAKSRKEKVTLHNILTSKDFDETALQGLEGKQGVTVTTL